MLVAPLFYRALPFISDFCFCVLLRTRTPMQMERIAQEAGEGVRRPKESVAALKHLDAPGQSSRVGMSRARRDVGMADSPSRQTQGADSFYSSPSSSNTLSSTASSRHSDERWFGSGDHTDPASGTEGTEYHTSGGVVVDQGTVTTTSTDSGIDLPPARATNGRSNGVHSRVSHQHIRGKSWTGGSTGLGFTSDDKGNAPRSGDCYSVESRATLSSPHNPSKSSSSSEDSHCTLVAGQQPLHITSTNTDSQKVSSSRKWIQGPSNTEAIRMSSSDGGSSSSGLGQTRLRASVRDLRSPKKSQLNSSMVEDLMKLITPDSPEPYPLANDSRERRLSLPRSPLASPFNRIMPRTLSDESICSGRRLSDRQRYEEQQSELAEDLAITVSSSGPQTSWMHSTFSPYESQHHELLLSLPNQGSLPLPLPDETSHLEWSSLVRAAQQFEATRTLENRPREPSQVPITRRSPGWSQPTLGCGDGMSPEVLFDKVSYLESMMKQMRDDLRKEKESKAILQSEVQNLRLDNQRLQHENKMSAKQLQRITKMFQDSRDRK
uniref:Signal-induced proliferation-associated 1-like protein C-terminal domain-containing protein n=1 Tax=Eptatretus burgeri TaxID=7764 RepID=A0A8C4WYK5_EPTBU